MYTLYYIYNIIFKIIYIYTIYYIHYTIYIIIYNKGSKQMNSRQYSVEENKELTSLRIVL